jgi:hypothetical protein
MTYGAAHNVVKRVRGRAAEQTCACGEPAKEWANLTGAYHDPEDYVAACIPCHRRLDGHYGEGHRSAKLTEEQVLEIRRRYAKGGVRQVDLAAEFGIDQTHVSDIVRRNVWRHV